LKMMDKDLSEGMLKAVFAFLLDRGEKPKSFMDKAELVTWDLRYFDEDPQQFEKNDFSVPNFSVSRNDLLKVLKVLAKSSDTTNSNCEARH